MALSLLPYEMPKVPMTAPKPSPQKLAARIMAILQCFQALPADPDLVRLVVAEWRDALENLPDEALHRAFSQWRDTQKWAPKISEIKALARHHIAQELRAATTEPEPEKEVISAERMREIANEMGMGEWFREWGESQ